MLQRSQSAPTPPSRANDEIVVVLYHSPCVDGAYAALAAWLFYSISAESNKPRGKSKGLSSFSSSSIRKVDLRFVPIYNTDTDAKKCNRVLNFLPATPALCSVIYVLDTFGGETLLRTLSTRARRVHVLDHHKSSCEEWMKLNGIQEVSSYAQLQPANQPAKCICCYNGQPVKSLAHTSVSLDSTLTARTHTYS
jgi:hypothetical protein